jgi:hypothetical protein
MLILLVSTFGWSKAVGNPGMQPFLFEFDQNQVLPFKPQLLKWVGNKQRHAHEIIAHFPNRFGTYFEPFLGSGGVLGTLGPEKAVASDVFKPLMEIWHDGFNVLVFFKMDD